MSPPCLLFERGKAVHRKKKKEELRATGAPRQRRGVGMNNQIKLQQPHMQLYTLPAVQSCLLTAAPHGPADTHTHTHTHTHTLGEMGWDNRRVTLRWSCLVCPFFLCVLAEDTGGTGRTGHTMGGGPAGFLLYVTRRHSPAQVEEGDLRRAISPQLWVTPGLVLLPQSVKSKSVSHAGSLSGGRWGERRRRSDWAARSSAQRRLSAARDNTSPPNGRLPGKQKLRNSAYCVHSLNAPGLWLTDPQADWVFLKKELEPHTDRQRLLGPLMCINYCAFC